MELLKAGEKLESQRLREMMDRRRSVRRFSNFVIPDRDIENCLRIAGSAPSGANSQPWFFSVVKSPSLKKRIREAAEEEEKSFYLEKATKETLEDLKTFETFWPKPHLEEASHLIAIFYKVKNEGSAVSPQRCYYPKESTGIATGFLISALHLLGYSCLTHTPQPMKFLNSILGRPSTEIPFLVLAVGKPHAEYKPPQISRKSDKEIFQFFSDPP